jgi:hypothetical protein
MGDAANMQQSQQSHSTSVALIVVLHNSLGTVQPVECFNKRNTRNTNHQRNQDYSLPKFSDSEVSVVLSFSASPTALAPSSPISLPTDIPRVERSNQEFSKTVQMGSAANRQSQHSSPSYSIHSRIERASPQSTFNSPASDVTHLLQQIQTKNTNHQEDYSPAKSSDNEVSVVLSIRASPNAFAPSSPIPLSTDTPKWRDPNTNSAEQFQWATLPTGNRNDCNDRTRYMVIWIVVLHNSLGTVQPVERFNKRNTRNTNHQRNQDYSQLKSSDNEVSVLFSFRALLNTFAPPAPSPFPTDTLEWRACEKRQEVAATKLGPKHKSDTHKATRPLPECCNATSQLDHSATSLGFR